MLILIAVGIVVLAAGYVALLILVKVLILPTYMGAVQ